MTPEVGASRSASGVEVDVTTAPRLSTSVLGQDLVQLLAGPLDDLDAAVELGGRPGVGDLLGRHEGLAHLLAEGPHPVVTLVAPVPGSPASALGPSLGGRPALVGELEGPTAALLGRAHQALVLQHLEGGVHRAGARPPEAAAAFLKPAHHLVAVGRPVDERPQDGPADVAPAHAPPPPAPPGSGSAHHAAGPHPSSAPTRSSRPVAVAMIMVMVMVMHSRIVHSVVPSFVLALVLLRAAGGADRSWLSITFER